MKSVEEQVEDWAKKELDKGKVRHFGKTEAPNPEIAAALDAYPSKSGGSLCADAAAAVARRVARRPEGAGLIARRVVWSAKGR